MLTDPELRSKVDQIWDRLWSSGLSNPMDSIEQFSYLSTAMLIFTRGGTTERIWFYDMEHNGFSLDHKRQPVAANDILDILACWQNRFDDEFIARREQRKEELKAEIAPLKEERLKLKAEINRLTFENVIAPADDEPTRLALEAVQAQLAQVSEQIAPCRGN